MRDICVDNFLMKCNPNHLERHSDSSDFENPQKIPAVAPKGGNHRLLNRRCYNGIQTGLLSEELNIFSNISNSDERKSRNKKNQCCLKRCENNNFKTNIPCKLDKGDINQYINERANIRSVVRDKVMPRLSTIFRRSNSNIRHMASIMEGKTDFVHSCNTENRLNNKRRHTCKNRRQRDYLVQPVYTVEEDVQTSPFHLKNDIDSLNYKMNNNCNVSNNISLSSEPGEENNKNNEYKIFLKMVKEKLEKEMSKEYNEKHYTANDQQQQYPSKLPLKLPYLVYTSASCLAKCSSTELNSVKKVPSNASAFWDYFAQKMKCKSHNKKPCDCNKPSPPCSPQTCQNLTPENAGNLKYEPQTDQSSSTESNTSLKKKVKATKVKCKCYSKKKEKSKSKKLPVTHDDKSRPCQESHDNLTAAISEKYNGEILCIHNPPCILINGCLNLPPPKSNAQGNLWPVTQNKKSSFVQMCRKIKRSKQKTYDNACQYHPPYADLQQCIPEYGTEKIIQSICNHEPPCEIVHGCYRAKYDPKLQNSCVHVPMCRKLPECVLVEKNSVNSLCKHNPKCAELPLCSRKYIVLTAREEVGTQVRPKAKMVCRHEPHCFMIPKCLAQAISGDYIPYGAIPGCVHNPQCENIPACCRKTLKQMTSVPSQYPNGCRLV